MTIQELKELQVLKQKLFKGETFVCFSKEEENSSDMKRYNQLMIKKQQLLKSLKF